MGECVRVDRGEGSGSSERCDWEELAEWLTACGCESCFESSSRSSHNYCSVDDERAAPFALVHLCRLLHWVSRSQRAVAAPQRRRLSGCPCSLLDQQRRRIKDTVYASACNRVTMRTAFESHRIARLRWIRVRVDGDGWANAAATGCAAAAAIAAIRFAFQLHQHNDPHVAI